FLDLVRESSRGDRLVHHPPFGNLEHFELGALFRALRGPVLLAPVSVDPARPVLAGVTRRLGPGLPLPRSLLDHHADAVPRWSTARLAGRLRAGHLGAGRGGGSGACLPGSAADPGRRSPSVRVARIPQSVRSDSYVRRSNPSY